MHESHRHCQVLSAKLLGLTKVAVAAAVCGAWLTPAAHGQCPSSFAAAVNYSVAVGTPLSVAIGDFNGDQRLDMALTTSTGNNLAIFNGNANGTFQLQAFLVVGANPHHMATGDFNGDGKTDLAVATAGGVSVLLGSAAGLQSSVTFGAGTAPNSVAVGDFNGDGRQDIAVANLTSNNVSILLGNGNGTFAAAVNYFVGSPCYAVAVGEFNGNAWPDLVVASGSGGISLLIGNGDGTFATAGNFGTGGSANFVAVGDLNGDGRADVAATNINSNVAVLLGNGNSSLAAAAGYAVGLNPVSVAIQDLNGDGRLDVATTNYDSHNVSVLLNNGNSTFAAAVNYAAGTNPIHTAIADFNGDGRPDLAVANFSSTNASVRLNTYTAFAPPAITQHPVSQIAQAGGSATFTAAANFFGSPSSFYQWRRNGVPLANGGNISGATTSTLLINPVTAADIASYDVQARGGCSLLAAVPSNPAVLSVNAIPNDLCANPRAVTNGSISFSNVGANTDGPNEANLGFGGGDLQVHQDVWFIYTATAIGTATVDLCGSNFDTKIAIYNATCPAGPNTAIAGNDDFTCGNGLQSQTTFACIAGNRYLIRVGGYLNNVGTVQMNVSCLGVPSCYANCDGSSATPILTANDFQCFLNKFSQGCP